MSARAGAQALPAQPAAAYRVARRVAVVAVVATALPLAVAASLALGAVHVPLGDAVDVLLGRAKDGPAAEIVLQLRLPRTVEALVVGAALGVAGSLLQGALANPLASPEVIGVTAGSGFGAIVVLLAFPEAIELLPAGALLFGLLAVALVLALAWGGRGAGSIERLILAGIGVSALFAAGMTSLMVAFSDRVQGAVLFLAGGFSSDGWEGIDVGWPYFAAGFGLAALLTGPLDRLALGDDVAASLGSRPRLVRLGATLAAALLAAASAAIAGLLGFVGLVVPHIVRLLAGTARNRFVVPVAGLAGAVLVLGADTLARTVVAPIELPVGPIMVLLGVPLFLYLLGSEA